MASEEYEEIKRLQAEQRREAQRRAREIRDALAKDDEEAIRQLRRINKEGVAATSKTVGDAKRLAAKRKQAKGKKAGKAQNKGCVLTLIALGAPLTAGIATVIHYL
jgi:hypothetical protein